MADEDLVFKVRGLGDIELAALLCLISREHCIISTEDEFLDDLTTELQLIVSQTFGLKSVVVDCTPETTLEDLVNAIQLPQRRTSSVPLSPSSPRARGPESALRSGDGSNAHGSRTRPHHKHTRSVSSITQNVTASPTQSRHSPSIITHIANVVLARNLDRASKTVQIQCLELMRTRRIFLRTGVQACPKQFLLVPVLGSESAGEARLTKHLNDHFYISHWHHPDDGFTLLEVKEGGGSEAEGTGQSRRRRRGDRAMDDNGGIGSEESETSVVHRTSRSKTPSTPIRTQSLRTSQHISTTDWAMPKSSSPPPMTEHIIHPLLTETDISTLATLSLQTHVDIDIQRYQMNIVAFLRLHRAVTPGSIPPSATSHFKTLLCALAALHGLEFATPELVQLAARKIYAHRIVITPPERERSMQWGSDLAAVKSLLEGVRPEDVIEDVLSMVEVPL